MGRTAIERLVEENEILSERVKQLERFLYPSAPVPLDWCLTRNEVTVFTCLVAREVADKEFIWVALYGNRPDDGPNQKIIDVFVCKIRKKLRKFGVEINNVWGRGYTLVNRTAYKDIAA